MADGGYSRSAQQCHVKVNNLKQKYRKIGNGNKMDLVLGAILFFNFRLQVCPSLFVFFADVNENIIE